MESGEAHTQSKTDKKLMDGGASESSPLIGADHLGKKKIVLEMAAIKSNDGLQGDVERLCGEGPYAHFAP